MLNVFIVLLFVLVTILAVAVYKLHNRVKVAEKKIQHLLEQRVSARVSRLEKNLGDLTRRNYSQFDDWDDLK